MGSTTKNKTLMIMVHCLRTAALLCATGTLMQVFLSNIGFSGREIYLHSCFTQAANFLSIFFFSRFADKEDIFRRCFAVCFVGGALFLAYLPLCFKGSASPISFILLLAVGCMQSITTGLYTICDYKIPYIIYKREEYASVQVICGIASSGISFSVGAVIAKLSTNFDYSKIMLVAFIISFGFLCVSGFSILLLKKIDSHSEEDHTYKKISLIEILKQPLFCKLIIPYYFRGFAAGITLVFAVIATDYLNYSEQSVTIMVSAHAVVTLASCVVFGFAIRFVPYKIIVLFGSLCFLLMPILLIPDKPVLFIIITSIIIFGRTLIDYAVPSILIYIIPAEIAGPYNAYRMFINNAGSFVATALISFLPTPLILVIALVSQIISGIYMFSFPPIRNIRTSRFLHKN